MTKRGIVAIVGVVVVAVALVLIFTLNHSSPENEPAPIYTIAIDAGHGGRDPGATADGVLEKDLNLEIAKRLQALIDAEPDLAARMTRTLDIFVSLEDRIRIAEEAGAVAYVSVHVNSYDTPDAYGVETIVADTVPQDDDSWVLAELIQDNLVLTTGARDRGTRPQESYTQHATMPAVSVEVGYVTNPEERANLVDPEYQAKIAEGILAGVRQFIEWKYPESVPPVQP
jgi:N-acetylmuramoyl-L-alanine amidase